MKHHLTTADIGTDNHIFWNKIRDYVGDQSEYVDCVYVDSTIYTYMLKIGHFSFNGSNLYASASGCRKFEIRLDHLPDVNSAKTRHILTSKEINTNVIGSDIIRYVNRQSSDIECVYLDHAMYVCCRNAASSYEVLHSFDHSKMWAKTRWGRIPILKLPTELAMLV